MGYQIKETGDNELHLHAKTSEGVGKIALDTGNAGVEISNAVSGINFGTDLKLYLKSSNVLSVQGVITGNGLTPNFVPALFGIHWNANASISYTGGSTHDLPGFITWSSSEGENIVQEIHYNENDQPDVITTMGAGTGRTATETLTWSGENLTGYAISFN